MAESGSPTGTSILGLLARLVALVSLWIAVLVTPFVLIGLIFAEYTRTAIAGFSIILALVISKGWGAARPETDAGVARPGERGGIEAVIRRLEGNYRELALALIARPSELRGLEIRFLRVHLGLSRDELAAVLRVDPSGVSRWEEDEAPIESQADRMLRTMVLRPGGRIAGRNLSGGAS